MADLSDYPRVLAVSPIVADRLAARGNDIPARLDLGWIWLESGGKIGDADTSVPRLGGELGLAQLSADERKATGYTDAARMTGKTEDDAVYQIDALHALIDYYSGYVGALGVEQGTETYWKLVKAAHGGGRGFMESLVHGYTQATGAAPDDWGTFEQWARENPFNGRFDYTEHHLSNADSVWSNGLALATAANLVPSGVGSVGGLVPFVAAAGLVAGVLWALKG